MTETSADERPHVPDPGRPNSGRYGLGRPQAAAPIAPAEHDAGPAGPGPNARETENERRFRDFAESSADCLWECDLDQQLTYLSGFPGQDGSAGAIGSTLGGLLTGLGADAAIADTLATYMAHGEAFRDVEFEQSKDDYSGNWVAWARISGKPVLDDEGGPIAYRGAILDITEQKRGEQALCDSQVRAARAHSQLVDAIESISDGFALYDADDRLVLSNTTYRELLPVVKTAQPGRSFEEILRAGVTSGNLPEGIGDEEAWVQNRLAQHRHPSDPTVQEYSNGLCLRIAERRTQDAGTVVVLTDITELIHGERELAEKPKLLHATLHNMSQGLAVFDRDLRLLAWNNRMLELLDLAPDLVHPDRSFAGIMDAIATDGCGDALAAIEHAVMRTRGAPTHEIKRSNGTVIEMHTGPMPDGGTVATYTDITPAKKREATLRRQALMRRRPSPMPNPQSRTGWRLTKPCARTGAN